MLIVTVRVNAPAGQAIGIKEDLAMHLERWGDAQVVSVTEETPKQQSFFAEKEGATGYGGRTGF